MADHTGKRIRVWQQGGEIEAWCGAVPRAWRAGSGTAAPAGNHAVFVDGELAIRAVCGPKNQSGDRPSSASNRRDRRRAVHRSGLPLGARPRPRPSSRSSRACNGPGGQHHPSQGFGRGHDVGGDGGHRSAAGRRSNTIGAAGEREQRFFLGAQHAVAPLPQARSRRQQRKRLSRGRTLAAAAELSHRRLHPARQSNWKPGRPPANATICPPAMRTTAAAGRG